jgi:hypothetical protein
MGADKNSSSRPNSAYAPNSPPRIPTRVCQGRVVTTDLPTLGTNPRQSQSESETQESKDLAIMRSLGQTVRGVLADGLKKNPDQPLQHLKIRTIRTLPGDGPGVTCAVRTIRQTCSNQKHLAQQIETKRTKNTRRPRRTAGRLAPCG